MTDAPATPTDPTGDAHDSTGTPDRQTAQAAPAQQQAPSMAEIFLAEAVVDVEAHVASTGWDAPLRVFALVSTQAALEAEPELAKMLPAETVEAARDNPLHLTSVEQVVERIILPPTAEEGIPEDPSAALAYLSEHPDRQDVRMAVGVLRDGTSWCALRSRSNDSAAEVAGGPALVPGLVEALRATFD